MSYITHEQAIRHAHCRKYLRELPRCQNPNCEDGKIRSLVTLRGQLWVSCGDAWHRVRWENCHGKNCGMCLTCAPESSATQPNKGSA